MTFRTKIASLCAILAGSFILSSSAFASSAAGYGAPPPDIDSPLCFYFSSTQCTHPEPTYGCLRGWFIDATDYVNSQGNITHYVWICEGGVSSGSLPKRVICSVEAENNCPADVDVDMTIDYDCGDSSIQVQATSPVADLSQIKASLTITKTSSIQRHLNIHGVSGKAFSPVEYDNKASRYYIKPDVYDLELEASYNGSPISIRDENGNLVPSIKKSNVHITNNCNGDDRFGCTNPRADNYDPNATVDDGSCQSEDHLGCMDPESYSFDPNATVDDGSCQYPDVTGLPGSNIDSGIFTVRDPEDPEKPDPEPPVIQPVETQKTLDSAPIAPKPTPTPKNPTNTSNRLSARGSNTQTSDHPCGWPLKMPFIKPDVLPETGLDDINTLDVRSTAGVKTNIEPWTLEMATTLEEASTDLADWVGGLPSYADMNKCSYIVVPTLGIVSPIYLPDMNSETFKQTIQGGLADTSMLSAGGVASYPGGGVPGENGNIVLYGHSSSLPPFGDYSTIFGSLPLIDSGDQMWIYLEGKRYVYEVQENEIVPSTLVSKLDDTPNEETLTAITCYPIGTAQKRVVVTAKRVSSEEEPLEEEQEEVEEGPLININEFCGNAEIDFEEQCDDGNNIDGDGCNSSCTLEFINECSDHDANINNNCVEKLKTISSLLTASEIAELPEHVNVNSQVTIGYLPYCGDGILWNEENGEEQCDDGNEENGDGCSDICTIESLEAAEPIDLLQKPQVIQEDIKTEGFLGKIIQMYNDLPNAVKLTLKIAFLLIILLLFLLIFLMKRKRKMRYLVSEGETLASIADMYATTERKLRSLNKKGRRWHPRAGKYIYVPNRHFVEKNLLEQLKFVMSDGLVTKLGKNKAWGKQKDAKQEKAQKTIELATQIQKNAGLFDEIAQNQEASQNGANSGNEKTNTL